MILLGTEVAGPAAYISSINFGKIKTKWVYSNKIKSFYIQKNIASIKKWKSLKNINCVITGTCKEGGLDQQIILWAKKNNIPSIACVDHWSLFNYRFRYKNKYLFPDKILVNDEHAKDLALNDGIPEEKINVVGNPILEKLFNKKISITKNNYLEKYHNFSKKKVLVFVSENLSEFKKNTKEYKGYDEFDVLKLINKFIKSNYILAIKLHPEENKKKFLKYINTKNTFFLSDIPVEEVAREADIIIGMESFFLIEMATLRNDVISLRPNSKHVFIGNILNATIAADSLKSLNEIKRKKMKKKEKFKNNFRGSSEKIIKLIKSTVNGHKSKNIRKDEGKEMFALAKKLWPLNRSLTGEGVRKTLKIINSIIKNMKLTEVRSGTKAFDWDVPKEWRVKNAYIINPQGKKICDFKNNNLHLVGYSVPVNKKLTLQELNLNLHSLESQPNAIPYVTSYYNENWGFCLTHNERKALNNGLYHVIIDSKLFNGSLTYGEVFIKGKSKKEIFLSTYICHPSMANNELSGPVVTTHLIKWLKSKKNLRYSYRIVFIPETIGSVVYLSRNYKIMKKNTIAGFNISCVGDDRSYSYLPSRNGNTFSDIIAKHVLKWTDKDYISYSWADRGSDERQYCSPGIDLPIASIMRTKYHEYEEYHTSLDSLGRVVTSKGLSGGYNVIKKAIKAIENNCFPLTKINGEPYLAKRDLYPKTSKFEFEYRKEDSPTDLDVMMDLISLSDGKNSLITIAEKINVPIWNLYPVLDKLVSNKIISIKNI